MNRRRFAISAAVCGAICYPIYTGSWSQWRNWVPVMESARWHDSDEAALAKMGTTPERFQKETDKDCAERENRGDFKSEGSGLFTGKDLEDSIANACRHPSISLGPEASLRSILVGMGAANSSVSKWFLDFLLGGVAAAVIAFLFPPLISRYLRWIGADN